MSAANCSFCSRPNDSIQVLCDSRCLLCARCQQSRAVRSLLINCNEADKCCPICSGPMAPNMIKTIDGFVGDSSIDNVCCCSLTLLTFFASYAFCDTYIDSSGYGFLRETK